VLRALQGHPEAARLWEEHISAILKNVGFKNTTHKKNICTGQFSGEKVLLVRQVNDFALGCRQAVKDPQPRVSVPMSGPNSLFTMKRKLLSSALAQSTPSTVASFSKLMTASSCLWNPAFGVW